MGQNTKNKVYGQELQTDYSGCDAKSRRLQIKIELEKIFDKQSKETWDTFDSKGTPSFQ